MPKDETVYLRHIRDSIKLIESYVAGLSEDEFSEQSMVRDAVIRQLEIIGEAAKRTGEENRAAESSIPWKSIAGLRDKLIHEYFGVDVAAVWGTVTQDLEPLKLAVERLLQRS
jgi:uncharacterized protein with HEPN domain